jgi:ABC-2 type transport system permease protein
MTTMACLLRAIRYEMFRLRTAASVRVLFGLGLLAIALATLPAGRELSAQLGGLSSAGTGAIAWVVGGGRLGTVLPGCVAAVAAAWLGAASIDYEYRHGTALALYASIPRRGTVLLAKALVVAALGILLELVGTALAFGTAALGFLMAGTRHPMPLTTLLASPPALVSAAACGALGVLLSAVLRVRLVAWLGALALAVCVTATVAAVPAWGAADPVSAPLRREALRLFTAIRLPADLTPSRLLGLALVSGLLLLVAVAAQCSVLRRRAE